MCEGVIVTTSGQWLDMPSPSLVHSVLLSQLVWVSYYLTLINVYLDEWKKHQTIIFFKVGQNLHLFMQQIWYIHYGILCLKNSKLKCCHGVILFNFHSEAAMFQGKHIHFSPVDQKPLCSFSAKLCRQRRLNGYAFCIRFVFFCLPFFSVIWFIFWFNCHCPFSL